jgi:hypothetical protein
VRGVPLGTTFRWTLSAPARVTITISRAASGRRVGRRCVPGARRGTRCTAFRRVGAIGAAARAGTGSLRFSGRLKGRPLAPGRYRAVVSVPGGAGRALTFTVVAPRRR